jgi:hypothetical protein
MPSVDLHKEEARQVRQGAQQAATHIGKSELAFQHVGNQKAKL